MEMRFVCRQSHCFATFALLMGYNDRTVRRSHPGETNSCKPRKHLSAAIKHNDKYLIPRSSGAVFILLLPLAELSGPRCFRTAAFCYYGLLNTEPQIPKFTRLQVLANIPEVIPTHPLSYQVCTGSRPVQKAHYPECFAHMLAPMVEGRIRLFVFHT